MKNFYMKLSVLALAAILSLPATGWGVEYTAEVMSVKGTAYILSADGQKIPLKEGDVVKVGSEVEVDKDSYLDLAYDSRWNNMTRVGAESKIKIRSIYPTDVYMDRGDMLAKLHKLPAKSTFEIETPTAVAAVRGSEYRTVYREGVTDVYNLHTSNVEVYGKDPDGSMMREPVILKENEKTIIDRLGDSPKTPEAASEKERNENRAMGDGLSQGADVKIAEGLPGKTQELETVEKTYRENLDQRLEKIQEKEAPREVGAVSDRPVKDGTAASDQKAPRGLRDPSVVTDKLRQAEERASAVEKNTQKMENRLQTIVDRVDTKVENVDRVNTATQDRKDPIPGDPNDPNKTSDGRYSFHSS